MFSSIIQKHAPIKRKRVKKVTQPNWFNSNTLQAIKKRNYYHKKNKNVPYYKPLRNRVKELDYKAKYDYFNVHLNSHKLDPKLLLRSVRELSGLNSTTQSPSLKNGNMIADPVITANLFNLLHIHQVIPT